MAGAIYARSKGCPVSLITRLAEALGLLSKHVPLPRPDDREAQYLRNQIAEAIEERERCSEHLAAVSDWQTEEADRAVEAIRGVIRKLDNLPKKRQDRSR